MNNKMLRAILSNFWLLFLKIVTRITAQSCMNAQEKYPEGEKLIAKRQGRWQPPAPEGLNEPFYTGGRCC